LKSEMQYSECQSEQSSECDGNESSADFAHFDPKISCHGNVP